MQVTHKEEWPQALSQHHTLQLSRINTATKGHQWPTSLLVVPTLLSHLLCGVNYHSEAYISNFVFSQKFQAWEGDTCCSLIALSPNAKIV